MDAQASRFIEQVGWHHATLTPITPDWSPRQYWRLKKADGQSAILLKGPAKEFRGHGLRAFIDLGAALTELGLSTPKIYAQDFAQQLLLIEDFGDTPIDTPAIQTQAYEAAVDVLSVLANAPIPQDLTHYKDGYIYKNLALFADVFCDGNGQAWMEAWRALEDALPPCPYVFGHMDYKAGNLHWLSARQGVQRIGILDYQAAQKAPFVYDIVNLLEDARRDVPPAIKATCKARFKAALPKAWQDMFDDWYAVIAAQFHARVLGQLEGKAGGVSADVGGRLRAYLRAEIQHPALAPIKAFMQGL